MVGHTAFETLSQLVESLETRDTAPAEVEATMHEGRLRASLTVPIDLSVDASQQGYTPIAVDIGTEGSICATFENPIREPIEAANGVSIESESAKRTGADGIVLAVELTIKSKAEASEIPEPATDVDQRVEAATGVTQEPESERPPDTEHPELAVRDESVPPYEDIEYLEALYESCETFGEMGERIEMDVSAETVRRYMIDAGVHSPVTYDSNADDAADDDDTHVEPENRRIETRLAADGIGLPEGVRIEQIVNAVATSRTVYEVQRELGLDRQATTDLLRRLNVLDLVCHRVADATQQPSQEEVTARIRECVPTTTPSTS
ncbi:hypothetical protein [Halalkalirubrum salinum]|uniref:hypothetical protein n=1 Tax=Halalkalirubrum salinum TaxID=2563889 RepID=UPI0010FB055D|nr:hypothetical protein [Halalkalirubrum salinum]